MTLHDDPKKTLPYTPWYRFTVTESNEELREPEVHREFSAAKAALGEVADKFLIHIKNRLKDTGTAHRVQLDMQQPAVGNSESRSIYRLIISYPDPSFLPDTRYRMFTVAPCPPPDFRKPPIDLDALAEVAANLTSAAPARQYTGLTQL